VARQPSTPRDRALLNEVSSELRAVLGAFAGLHRAIRDAGDLLDGDVERDASRAASAVMSIRIGR
jgi:hypothetical protein